jgi:hypothetical protein
VAFISTVVRVVPIFGVLLDQIRSLLLHFTDLVVGDAREAVHFAADAFPGLAARSGGEKQRRAGAGERAEAEKCNVLPDVSAAASRLASVFASLLVAIAVPIDIKYLLVFMTALSPFCCDSRFPREPAPRRERKTVSSRRGRPPAPERRATCGPSRRRALCS